MRAPYTLIVERPDAVHADGIQVVLQYLAHRGNTSGRPERLRWRRFMHPALGVAAGVTPELGVRWAERRCGCPGRV